MSQRGPLRGASAEAYAALSAQLKSELQQGGDAARIGDELFGVAQLLRAEPSLRRITTDVAVATAAKQKLVRELLTSKLAAQSLSLVENAVAKRWTKSRDLADALESMSVEAIVRSTGGDSDRLADELFVVGQTLTSQPELRDALSDPARSVSDKAALLRGLLQHKALPATTTLATHALSGTYRTVNAALESYQQIAADVHGERVATVRVARSLSPADKQRLTQTLSRHYDREIHLNEVVDPSVIGGIRVEIGDEVIDGTVSARLDDARRRLVS